MSGRYCHQCNKSVEPQHMADHHRARIEGNLEYQKQIQKDYEAGMIQAEDKREKMP